jgi:hypothetical protein
VVGPVILIGVGIVFLLNNLGVLPWDVWGNIWRFWPVILVVVGLEVLFGRRFGGGAVALVAIGLVVAVVGGGAAFARVAPAEVTTRTFSSPTEGASQLTTTVNFGAGKLTVGALDATNAAAGEMRFTGTEDQNPSQSYRVRNGTGELGYSVRGNGNFTSWFSPQRAGTEMRVGLSPNLPMRLNLKTGAAESTIDLSKLKLTFLDIDTGASNTFVRLPEAAGVMQANVDGGAANITIEIPLGVAANIEFDGGLSSLHIDQTRFPSVGRDRYRSPDYDTAVNKVDLKIDLGAANATVR